MFYVILKTKENIILITTIFLPQLRKKAANLSNIFFVNFSNFIFKCFGLK